MNKKVLVTFLLMACVSVCFCGCKSGYIESNNYSQSSTIATTSEALDDTQNSINKLVVSESEVVEQETIFIKEGFQSSSISTKSSISVITSSSEKNVDSTQSSESTAISSSSNINDENPIVTSSDSGYFAGDW